MIQSSFPKVADQIISFNKNLIDSLSKLNNLVTTTNSTVTMQIHDEEGVLRNFTLPSFKSLKNEIDRLNNNINSLYGIDDNGSLIQTSSSNKFRKVITVDLNKDPIPVSSLGNISKFKSKVNWFFDSLTDPMIQVELDLGGKIEDNVSKCMIRRYIVDFEKNVDGYTDNGQSALNSYNKLFRDNANILIDEFQEWHKTTPGIVEPLYPRYDEDKFNLEPNTTMYDGEFSVLRMQEDRLNKKLWYIIDKLDYIITETSEVKQLTLGDELIVNTLKTSTRYKIIEISTEESNPRIRVERVEGIEPIPVGVGTLKIYSPVIYNKNIKVSVSYSERNIIFLKPINSDNNLVAKKWSFGTGFYTNDLRLESSTPENGLTMEKFYTEYVYDYGESLKDLVAKKIPNRLAGIPLPPVINTDNFKVVQINKHLTNTTDKEMIKKKHNHQNSLKSEITQIDDSIRNKNKSMKLTKHISESDKKRSGLELNELSNKKESKSRLLTTVTREIIDISRKPNNSIKPKFRLRGFWNFPDAIPTRGTLPQEIIQFKVQYRYVNSSGTETPIEQFKVDGKTKGSFSNWVEYKTDIRKRIFDSDNDEYYWEIEDVENPDTPNVNQLDITIQQNEKVEFRIKSISEVGWPESPVESTWSEIHTFSFPDDLKNVLSENDFIVFQANKEEIRLSLTSELQAKGLDDHLSDTISMSDKMYHHDSSKILSGFKDSEGNAIDLFDYLKSLEAKVKSLEDKIANAKGTLEIAILRNNQEFVVSNGSESVFNVECEDYLEAFTDTGITTGRVYENNVYIIKDFVVRIRNKSASPLGLLSDKTYLNNTGVYNPGAPQTFWVNEQDELIRSDITSKTRTQLNNQFIWMVNYDSISEQTVSKLSDNIGNSFTNNNIDSNSVTSVLSSSQYNLGYNETNILSFIGNNDSLLDPDKWIDVSTSVNSTDKLLTSIHPVVKKLEDIVETNSDKIKEVNQGDKNDIIIPINIYFKMNALDTNQSGLNYQYIDLNKSRRSIKHKKKIKFLIENEAENRPFIFNLKFNINRNKIIFKKTTEQINDNIM